jgi:hypothetical protein
MSHTDSESKTKADVYYERNLLALAFLAVIARAAHFHGDTVEMGWWPDHDDVNGEEWAVVWTNLHHGQVGWHIPIEMVPEWLDKRDPDYDGYSTGEKNVRMREFIYPTEATDDD